MKRNFLAAECRKVSYCADNLGLLTIHCLQPPTVKTAGSEFSQLHYADEIGMAVHIFCKGISMMAQEIAQALENDGEKATGQGEKNNPNKSATPLHPVDGGKS